MALTPNRRNPDAVNKFTIDDFTPGINRWSRSPGVVAPTVGGAVAPSYMPYGPKGSAAHAYRCYARQGVGLLPLPTYRVAQVYTVVDASHPVCVSLGNMMTLAGRGGVYADIVSAFLVQHGTGFGAATDFGVARQQVDFVNFAPTFVYTSSAGQFPRDTTSWPMMDHAVFANPPPPSTVGVFARTVVTTDPISTSFTTTTASTGKWVTVRGWTTPTVSTAPESSNGTFGLIGLIGSYPRVFYHEARMGIWQIGSAETVTNNFVASDADVLYVSNLLDPTTIIEVGTFFPEMGTTIGAWGSWSTGELIVIYAEGGAVLINGDMTNSQNTKLGGVMGTGGAWGRGALTPIGMVYPRLHEAVYMWNGDNTAQKISAQIPDGVFTRTPQANGFASSGDNNTSTQVWGEWVVFPNNWMFDTVNQSWWLVEDPTVINFQVYGGEQLGTLLSAPGPQYAAAGENCSLNTYFWDKGWAASSWFWQSNPIPVTIGNLVTITSVEIVASNQTATPARITVQPVSPAQPYPTNPLVGQNNNMVFFDIPAHVSGFRASHRLGYDDYNIQLAVNAMNTDTGQAAPTLHAINLEYGHIRPAGIQS